MSTTYYTLLVREDGVWAPEFGDYDRDCVKTQLEYLVDDFCCGARRKDTKIIKTAPEQSAINAAVAKLNARQ